jgi:hypothetical protein
LQLASKALILGVSVLLNQNLKHMKQLKKTRVKLPSGEEVIGQSIPDSLLNQDKLKKLGKAKSRTSKKRKK